jgi:superfamily II DNA/RNA helicase
MTNTITNTITTTVIDTDSDLIDLTLPESSSSPTQSASSSNALSFESLSLPSSLINALIAVGYVKPNEIQGAAIRTFHSNQHVIVHSPAATGKTLIYLIVALKSY